MKTHGIKSVEIIRCFCVLSLCVMSLAILTGCPSSRVSMWTRGPKGNPIKPEEVNIVSNLKDMKPSYRIEGMLCAMKLPAMRNNAERRGVLVKEIAAEQGINSIIGLQPKIGELYYGSSSAGFAVGILANSGISVVETSVPPPKFIVCLPPARFKINLNLSKADQSSTVKADAVLRDTIQLLFARKKGYYVYKTDLPIADPANMPLDSCNSMGISADYILNCDMEVYERMNEDNTDLVWTFMLRMTLFDLKERNVAWTRVSEYNFPLGVNKGIGDYALEALAESALGLATTLTYGSNSTVTVPSDSVNSTNNVDSSNNFDFLSPLVHYRVEDIMDSIPPATADFK